MRGIDPVTYGLNKEAKKTASIPTVWFYDKANNYRAAGVGNCRRASQLEVSFLHVQAMYNRKVCLLCFHSKLDKSGSIFSHDVVLEGYLTVCYFSSASLNSSQMTSIS